MPMSVQSSNATFYESSLVDSPFGLLPLEVSIDIFRHLGVNDLLSCFLVCRLWNLESTNEQLWKTVVIRNYSDMASLRPSAMPWRMFALALAGLKERTDCFFFFFLKKNQKGTLIEITGAEVRRVVPSKPHRDDFVEKSSEAVDEESKQQDFTGLGRVKVFIFLKRNGFVFRGCFSKGFWLQQQCQ